MRASQAWRSCSFSSGVSSLGWPGVVVLARVACRLLLGHLRLGLGDRVGQLLAGEIVDEAVSEGVGVVHRGVVLEVDAGGRLERGRGRIALLHRRGGLLEVHADRLPCRCSGIAGASFIEQTVKLPKVCSSQVSPA